MPRARLLVLDVGVILVRQVRAVDRDDGDFRRCGGDRLARLGLVGLQEAGLRMLGGPAPGEARDQGILEHEHRIATHEVTPPEALADEHRVLVGAIVIGHVHLVEPAVEVRDEDG